MGQDRVDAWPSPQSFFPSPERKRENGVALCPEWPQPALWACALGKGLVTWPLWSRHFVSPILSPQPQSSISPSHCGHGLEGPRYLLPPPWYTGFYWGHQGPPLGLLPSVVHGVWCPWAPGQIRPYLVSTPIPTVNVPLNKVGETRKKKSKFESLDF